MTMIPSHGSPYSVPPGLLGEIARFIYDAAPRPVPEIALAGAIGLFAGIVGRSYNASGVGLNLYTLLLAPTGTGKEAIASGVTALMKPVREIVPASADFIGPASIASAQALIKYLAAISPSFVSILGEFGLTMQQMATPRAPSHLVGLRQVILDLFGKSGRNGELRPSIYSDREKNTAAVQSPAFSIIGESTPESFYQGLSERLIADGLLTRFVIIEYRGARKPLQENRLEVPPSDLVERLATICAYSLDRNHQGKAVDVLLTDDAHTILSTFDAECDARINEARNEVTRHLWNRAHIKALKLASLVAVGCNPYDPRIWPDAALWAIGIERANVCNLLSRFEAGEVGEQASSEMAQQSRLRIVIADWVTKPWEELKRYKIGNADMHRDRVIPHSYISKRLTNDAAFRDAKTGATATIKRTVEELSRCGEIGRVSPRDAEQRYQTRMECYAITDAQQFLAKIAGGKSEV